MCLKAPLRDRRPAARAVPLRPRPRAAMDRSWAAAPRRPPVAEGTRALPPHSRLLSVVSPPKIAAALPVGRDAGASRSPPPPEAALVRTQTTRPARHLPRGEGAASRGSAAAATADGGAAVAASPPSGSAAAGGRASPLVAAASPPSPRANPGGAGGGRAPPPAGPAGRAPPSAVAADGRRSMSSRGRWRGGRRKPRRRGTIDDRATDDGGRGARVWSLRLSLSRRWWTGSFGCDVPSPPSGIRNPIPYSLEIR